MKRLVLLFLVVVIANITQAAVPLNSNSAMVVPGNSVTFDINLAARKWMDVPKPMMPDFETELTAEVLWVEGVAAGSIAITGIDKSKKTMTVRTSAGANGNAVVALKGANGAILWSWHVWVTDYVVSAVKKTARTADATYTAGTRNGVVHTYGQEFFASNEARATRDVVIMDRNLGATWAGGTPTPSVTDAEAVNAYGLYYQWGRKDPFPREGNVVATTGDEGESVAYSIQNPDKFIKRSDNSPWGWISEPNDDLWGASGVKSPYDPCPAGWRVSNNGVGWRAGDRTLPSSDDDNTWGDFRRADMPWYFEGNLIGESADDSKSEGATPGRLYTAKDTDIAAWYPASGLRHLVAGRAISKGYSGHYWSSSPNGTYSCAFAFNNTTFNSSDICNRAMGFPVRCLQE